MRSLRFGAAIAAVLVPALALAWTPLAVEDDPLVRMPGSQPTDGITVESPTRCMNCHAGYDQPGVDPEADPGTS